MATDAEVLANIANGGDGEVQELDTFDNPTPIPLPKESKKNVEEKEDKPDLKKSTQVDKLDETEDKPAEKKEEKKEVIEDEKEKIESETQEKGLLEKKSASNKTIRVKDGDDTIDISPDATVKVKVAGKNEFKTIKQLTERWSLAEGAEQKFQKATEKEKEATQKYAKFQQEHTEITQHLSKVSQMLDDPKANPLAALHYLVDISGRNVYDFNKRVHDYMSGEIQKLSEMDDVEKALYWKDQELNYLKSNHAAKSDLEKNTNAEKERIASVDRLRESQGVSEEQFVQAFRDLTRLGYGNEATPEAIVEYAVMRPFYDKAEELCSAYNDDLGDEQKDQLVETVSRTLRAYPKLNHEKVLRLSAESLGWTVEDDEDDISDIEKKTSSVKSKIGQKTPKEKPTKHGYESFDDFAP